MERIHRRRAEIRRTEGREVARLCGEWDAQFGDVSLTQVKGYKTVPIVWWDFLTSDAPCSPVDGLREGDVLRIWNSFMSPALFKLLNLSVE